MIEEFAMVEIVYSDGTIVRWWNVNPDDAEKIAGIIGAPDTVVVSSDRDHESH